MDMTLTDAEHMCCQALQE